MQKKIIAEFLGTAGLLIVVVGSGIMGENLAQGNSAITLLANSLATGAGIYALIKTFAPLSGAHFNPAVSFVECLWKRLSPRDFATYALAQVSGGIAGVWITHIMFGQKLIQLSTHNRGDFRFLISEIVATFGLILVIALSGKKSVEATPAAIAAYISAAYWCTSSTSFANPAVTIARSFTDTYSGILWSGVPAFVAAQLFGVLLAFYCLRRLV